MPYNTTAIPPRKEPTGQTQLPLSRVKKIISQDDAIHMCSNNAAFVITCAAEMFVQHLADEAHTQAKLERKPRRNIQYKDVANAVSHQDNLEFLEDVVPKTVPYKRIKGAATTTAARLRGENPPSNDDHSGAGAGAGTVTGTTATGGGGGQLNGRRTSIINGQQGRRSSLLSGPDDDEDIVVGGGGGQMQIDTLMKRRRGSGDVHMTG